MPIKLLPKRLIGQTIRGIRNRLGQTPAEFAETVGVEEVETILAWERGEQQPDYATLARVAAMGVVDVLVFADPTDAADGPQLTPGEAQELDAILGRMEALLDEARDIVRRASRRTVLDVLEEAAGTRPRGLPEGAEAGVSLELHAEVVPTERRGRSSGGGRSSSSSGGSRGGGGSKPASRSGSGRASSSSSSSDRSSSSSSGRSGGKSGSGSKTASSGSKSPGSRSTRSRSGSGSSGGGSGSSGGSSGS